MMLSHLRYRSLPCLSPRARALRLLWQSLPTACHLPSTSGIRQYTYGPAKRQRAQQQLVDEFVQQQRLEQEIAHATVSSVRPVHFIKQLIKRVHPDVTQSTINAHSLAELNAVVDFHKIISENVNHNAPMPLPTPLTIRFDVAEKKQVVATLHIAKSTDTTTRVRLIDQFICKLLLDVGVPVPNALVADWKHEWEVKTINDRTRVHDTAAEQTAKIRAKFHALKAEESKQPRKHSHAGDTDEEISAAYKDQMNTVRYTTEFQYNSSLHMTVQEQAEMMLAMMHENRLFTSSHALPNEYYLRAIRFIAKLVTNQYLSMRCSQWCGVRMIITERLYAFSRTEWWLPWNMTERNVGRFVAAYLEWKLHVEQEHAHVVVVWDVVSGKHQKYVSARGERLRDIERPSNKSQSLDTDDIAAAMKNNSHYDMTADHNDHSPGNSDWADLRKSMNEARKSWLSEEHNAPKQQNSVPEASNTAQHTL